MLALEWDKRRRHEAVGGGYDPLGLRHGSEDIPAIRAHYIAN